MPDTYTKLRYHIVFGTKYRAPLITPDVRDALYGCMAGILTRRRGTLLAIGGMPEHVHLLVGLRATHSLADIMQKLKANSSRWMNEREPRTDPFAWQVGYGAFSVSESRLTAVRNYIARQEAHHRKVPLDDELQELLRKHGFKPDPTFLAG